MSIVGSEAVVHRVSEERPPHGSRTAIKTSPPIVNSSPRTWIVVGSTEMTTLVRTGSGVVTCAAAGDACASEENAMMKKRTEVRIRDENLVACMDGLLGALAG
jgi:hypothetical protein